MFRLPLEKELECSERILLAGCGGGYDIFCGLPIYHNLVSNNKKVFLANLSFSDLENLNPKNTRKVCDYCWEVTHKTDAKSTSYFPEKHLADFFAQKNKFVSVFCFEIKTGVVPLRKAYETLVKELNIDTIILCDGGTDSLMFGNEQQLGSPTEDSTSLAAVYSIQSLKPITKLLVCLGFGIDTFHGVNHYHFLENTSSVIKKNGYLGNFSIVKEMDEFVLFQQATTFVFEKMSFHKSIVNSSIIDATLGNFGDFHSTDRTTNSTLFINPMMSIYWCYKLQIVVELNQYIPILMKTETRIQVQTAISEFRRNLKSLRKPETLPV